jgi:hypothetical protein
MNCEERTHNGEVMYVHEFHIYVPEILNRLGSITLIILLDLSNRRRLAGRVAHT